MCLGRHTRRNENGASRRLFYRSAGTRAPVRWDVPQSAGATALVSSARTMQESPRATVPMGVFREVRRLAQRTGPGALSSRAPGPSGLGRGLQADARLRACTTIRCRESQTVLGSASLERDAHGGGEDGHQEWPKTKRQRVWRTPYERRLQQDTWLPHRRDTKAVTSRRTPTEDAPRRPVFIAAGVPRGARDDSVWRLRKVCLRDGRGVL